MRQTRKELVGPHLSDSVAGKGRTGDRMVASDTIKKALLCACRAEPPPYAKGDEE